MDSMSVHHCDFLQLVLHIDVVPRDFCKKIERPPVQFGIGKNDNNNFNNNIHNNINNIHDHYNINNIIDNDNNNDRVLQQHSPV
mmetsp:Transcript_115086/g.199712  ORF Transcript_115086/g.199712 Transcript_115086/m.199712 type:complete len:84 (-) Transcript_115086:381-632(-)